MRKIILTLAALLPSMVFAQDANALLRKFSEQMQKAKNLSVAFEYVYESQAENIRQGEAGTLLLLDNMYKLDLDASTIYFNGEVRWTYFKAANEVTISLPNVLTDGIFANPTALFVFDEKEYNSKLRSEKMVDGKTVVEVDLFPKDEQASFTNINLRMDKSTLQPVGIVYYDKNGSSVAIAVTAFDTSAKLSPADFTFDVKKHPNVEVVDMR